MSFWRKEEIPVYFFLKSIHINFHKHVEKQVTPTSFKLGQNIWMYPVGNSSSALLEEMGNNHLPGSY